MTVQPPREELAFGVEQVEHRVRVRLDGRGEDDDLPRACGGDVGVMGLGLGRGPIENLPRARDEQVVEEEV